MILKFHQLRSFSSKSSSISSKFSNMSWNCWNISNNWKRIRKCSSDRCRKRECNRTNLISSFKMNFSKSFNSKLTWCRNWNNSFKKKTRQCSFRKWLTKRKFCSCNNWLINSFSSLNQKLKSCKKFKTSFNNKFKSKLIK